MESKLFVLFVLYKVVMAEEGSDTNWVFIFVFVAIVVLLSLGLIWFGVA